MQKTDEFILNRLTWKAKKQRLPGLYSFFFTDLSLDIRAHLNSQRHTELSGLPGIFFTKPTKEWTLICTRQVIFNDNSNIIALNLRDIDKISTTVFDSSSRTPRSDVAKMKSKTEWDTIKITTKQNDTYILHANKGSELFALWNILLMMSSLNQ